MSGKLSKITGRLKRLPVPARIALTAASVLLLFYLAFLLIPYPQLSVFLKRQNSTRFYDRNGSVLYILPLSDGLRREYYPLDEIPEQLQKIFIYSEDRYFYFHPGVNLSAIIRAARQNAYGKRTVSGASTITMQLARIVTPRGKGSAVTVAVKIREMINAFRIEAKLSKKKILELYINSLPFGQQTEGAGSAARTFFGRSIKELSAAQMLALSVIPRRPSYYSLFNNPANSYDAAMETGKKINFYVTAEEWEKLAAPHAFTYPNECPHYINWISGQFAKDGKRIPDKLELAVDSALNLMIEKAIQEQISLYEDARINNGAAFVINNKTGQIVAWIGNGDFQDPNGGQINGVVTERQAGSAMKPFLYALALESGFEPSAVLPDIPQDFGGANVYVPLNFNNRYNGPQRMRVCLGSSLNIPAVYLLYRLGIDNYMNSLYKCGFDSLKGTRESTGLSLALGSSEVSLYELVCAFSIFPRDGTLPEIHFEKSAVSETKSAHVFRQDTSRIICDFLSDKNARALGFGRPKAFDAPYPCIFKTGTSNQFQDIVALGATSLYTAGVWLGNFNGETVIKKTGSSIPAGIVRMILDYLTENGTSPGTAEPFSQPEFYKKVPVCTLSGMTPSADCPSIAPEYVRNADSARNKELSEVSGTCGWHYRQNGLLKIRYPSEYQHWAAGRNMSGSAASPEDGFSYSTPLDFLYPTDGAVFIYDRSVPKNVQYLRVQAYGGESSEAELFVNGKSAGAADGLFAWQIPLEYGTYTLTVNCAGKQKSITYSVK